MFISVPIPAPFSSSLLVPALAAGGSWTPPARSLARAPAMPNNRAQQTIAVAKSIRMLIPLPMLSSRSQYRFNRALVQEPRLSHTKIDCPHGRLLQILPAVCVHSNGLEARLPLHRTGGASASGRKFREKESCCKLLSGAPPRADHHSVSRSHRVRLRLLGILDFTSVTNRQICSYNLALCCPVRSRQRLPGPTKQRDS